MPIWNHGTDKDAPDRSEIELFGFQPVHIALIGNRYPKNPYAHNKFQHDRLAATDLPGCDHEDGMNIIKESFSNFSLYGICATAMLYNPQIGRLIAVSELDCYNLIILEEGEKTHVFRPPHGFTLDEGRFIIDQDLPSLVKEMAPQLGMNPENTKVHYLSCSDGLLDSGGRRHPKGFAHLEDLHYYAQQNKRFQRNIASAMASEAIHEGSTDNLSVIYLPNLLAHRKGALITAAIADGPDNSPSAQKFIEIFQNECAHTIAEKDPARSVGYRPSKAQCVAVTAR